MPHSLQKGGTELCSTTGEFYVQWVFGTRQTEGTSMPKERGAFWIYAVLIAGV